MSVQYQDIEIELSAPQDAVLAARMSMILNMSGQGGGKSQCIGYLSGMNITDFPMARGFIGANTQVQLSQSTLSNVFKVWKALWGYEEYDPKSCPHGAYVVDKKPPMHFHKVHKLRRYEGTISFYNGCLVYIGSLENYKAHDGKEFAWAHLDETKDTDPRALTDVIMGRLRQYGMWYDKNNDIHWGEEVREDEIKEKGLTAWNPLYIHTSPELDGSPWINEMFKLSVHAKEIKEKTVVAKDTDFFYKEFENKAVVIYSAYHNRRNLPPNYLSNQEKNQTTEDDVNKKVHGYPFGKSGSEWLPAFRRDYHVTRVPYVPGVACHQTWDFNVMPYMTCLLARVKFVGRYIDDHGNKHDVPVIGSKFLEVMRISFYREYCFETPLNTTEAICDQFKLDHPTGIDVFYYGDGSGLSQIPGLGSLTNFKIITEALAWYLNEGSKRVKFPNIAPLTRRNLVNRILAGKIPEVEVEFDEGMEKTINDLENVKLGKDGKIKPLVEDPRTGKKYESMGHCSDAVEYMLCELCKEYILQNP